MPKSLLERPDLFVPHGVYRNAAKIGRIIERNAQDIDDSYQPNIAVLIRTKNDKIGLKRILDHVARARKSYHGRIDVIVADTESTDGTVELAKTFGATIVPILQAEFNYPRAMNKSLGVVHKDVVATFITVGHAQPVLTNCLPAAIRHFKDKEVVGVYGRVVMSEKASSWEKLLFQRIGPLLPSPRNISEIIMGVMGATNCMVRMSTWRHHAFDEIYAAGGEDTAWAIQAIDRGERIIFDAAASVHHSHGLGLINIWRQSRYWYDTYRTPTAFREKDFKRRRPDLFKSR